MVVLVVISNPASRSRPGRDYAVAGWASVNPGTEGPPVWDLVERHVARLKTVRVAPNRRVKVVGA